MVQKRAIDCKQTIYFSVNKLDFDRQLHFFFTLYFVKVRAVSDI